MWLYRIGFGLLSGSTLYAKGACIAASSSVTFPAYTATSGAFNNGVGSISVWLAFAPLIVSFFA